MRKLSPIILALALSPLVQAESVSEVSPTGKIDSMVSLQGVILNFLCRY